MQPIGRRWWAMAEGYIQKRSHGPGPVMARHDTACLLHAGDADAHVRITACFSPTACAGEE